MNIQRVVDRAVSIRAESTVTHDLSPENGVKLDCSGEVPLDQSSGVHSYGLRYRNVHHGCLVD